MLELLLLMLVLVLLVGLLLLVTVLLLLAVLLLVMEVRGHHPRRRTECGEVMERNLWRVDSTDERLHLRTGTEGGAISCPDRSRRES